MDVVLFHNPACPVSCKVRDLLHEEGIEPVIFDYLKTPPKAEELRAVLKLLKVGPRRIIKAKEPIYQRLGLSDPTLTEGQLIRAMAANPQLIDGPLVVTEDEAILARPAEKVFNII
jgi:arsenate reductase (glutaredoxin)